MVVFKCKEPLPFERVSALSGIAWRKRSWMGARLTIEIGPDCTFLFSSKLLQKAILLYRRIRNKIIKNTRQDDFLLCKLVMHLKILLIKLNPPQDYIPHTVYKYPLISLHISSGRTVLITSLCSFSK